MADKKTNQKATAKPTKPKPPEKVDLAAEEKKLSDTYPDRKIVRGSIKDAGTTKEFGNKRSVEIRCQGAGTPCNNTRRVATSDLHQVTHCTDCIKAVRLQRRKDQRTAKRKTNPTKPKVLGKVSDGKPTKKKPDAKKDIKVQPKPKAPGGLTPATTQSGDTPATTNA